MSAVDKIPAELLPLIEGPNYGLLGTIRPDDTVQVNPMWFEFDGEVLRFTHTTYRQKYKNLQHNPAMSLVVLDPQNPLVYLELRGRLIDVVPDPEGAFYVRMGKRYGNADQQPPQDSPDRVILVMSIDRVSTK
jgi:PPOX class probable F420-dependent enzyme